jgi:7,8-dihydropterin-6-yl-methyl-4-(beta-D-ribofuranosyl)aminobenzene 5'-phosphate synthase
MDERIALEPVDAVEVTIVVDNAIDMLAAPSEIARRPPRVWEWVEQEQLRAEHGYALLVRVYRGGSTDTLLYDAGLGRDTAVHNLDVLDVELADIRAMVLSHGHADHHNGLEGLIRRRSRWGLPLVLHPDVWRDRKAVFPNGQEMHLPPPNRAALAQEGWEIVEERGPSLLLEGAVLVSGQVARTTEFERGFPPPFHQAFLDGRWQPDPAIPDDQGVIVHVRDQGLVVLSGCSHAGAINLLRNARRLTGIERVHAFVGGMHLSGGLFESIIGPTVQELVALAPAIVVPGHCTGWKATNAIVGALPAAYIQSNVGTTLRFAASGGDTASTVSAPSPA